MKIGILGTGAIAGRMAVTLRQMEDVECYAAASRTLQRAEGFCAANGFQRAYGSYEELVTDEEVDLIYIATPHSEHFRNMMLCIEHGRPVLCEKSFTLDASEARRIQAAAKEHGVYVTEALWSRFMPSRTLIEVALMSGLIGEVRSLTANLSLPIAHKERIQRAELGGGALLDIGIYGLNFALTYFGTDIDHVVSSAQLTGQGMDAMESITLHYRNGRMAVLTHDIYTRSDRRGVFQGDKGYMVIENIINPSAIRVYDLTDKLIQDIAIPEQISGYEYEVYESLTCIETGRLESFSMTLDDTIFRMELMDSLREKWGVRF